MSAFKNLVGQTFGRLTVIERVENNKHGRAQFLCRCTCGAEVIVLGKRLRNGGSKSCGCLNREKTAERSKTHEMTHTKIYHLWQHIKDRCFNPNCKDYPNYGGRGISMYPEWISDFQAFHNYVSTLEHYGDDNYSLDRIDNSKGYEPNNLRLADRKTQGRNKRNNIIVEYNGVEMTLAEAAEKTGINHEILRQRYHRGERGDKLFRPVQR